MAKIKKYETYLVEAKNEVMRAKMPYTALEQKVAGLILSCINPTDDHFKKYPFKTAEILRMLKLGKEYRLLYAVTEGLLKNPITINTPDGVLYQANIIADAKYTPDRSTVTFSIADDMRKYLLQLDGEYTRFYLSNILGLRSKYSIAMYRFLKSFEFQKCVTKTVEELKFCLGLESQEYKLFADLKRYALEVSRLELEEKTDIRFEYFPAVKNGKKVISITFTINWNPNFETRANQLKQVVDLKEKDLNETKEKLREIKSKIKPGPVLSKEGLTPEQIHAIAAESLKNAGKANKIKDNGDLDF
jgi:plasmid replication initiation protein